MICSLISLISRAKLAWRPYAHIIVFLLHDIMNNSIQIISNLIVLPVVWHFRVLSLLQCWFSYVKMILFDGKTAIPPSIKKGICRVLKRIEGCRWESIMLFDWRWWSNLRLQTIVSTTSTHIAWQVLNCAFWNGGHVIILIIINAILLNQVIERRVHLHP